MASLSLLHQGNELADPATQTRLLDSQLSVPTFGDQLQSCGLEPLTAGQITTLQINVGRVCNQTCVHCHVDAGPDRRESMSRQTAEQCIAVLANHAEMQTLDITGGAPEMNPNFRWLVEQGRSLGKRVIDRCNLTILLAKGFTDLPEFLAQNQVEIIASLPCYLEENTDAQRGKGTHAKSIHAIKKLNQLGYGIPDSGLELTLVYNPLGVNLPSDQQQLEEAYRNELRERFGVEFTRLFTIANLPISRFLEDLVSNDQLTHYLNQLVQHFNPATVSGLMCRSTLSVDWQGKLYDCDFNQMLNLASCHDSSLDLWNFDAGELEGRRIVVGRHCFGCSAGSGSGCTGAIV